MFTILSALNESLSQPKVRREKTIKNEMDFVGGDNCDTTNNKKRDWDFFKQTPACERGQRMQQGPAGSALASPEVVSLPEIQRCVEGRQEQLEQVLREAFVSYTGMYTTIV